MSRTRSLVPSLLSGVAAAQSTTQAILTTGLFLIVVEGFSMGIGSFLTEETSEEMTGDHLNTSVAIKGGLTTLVSYIIAGLLPLAPYAFLPPSSAMSLSIFSALLGLFLLGFGTSAYYHRPAPFARALKMLFLGGLVVGIGVLIDKMVGETIPFVQFLKRQMLDFFSTAGRPYLTWKEELVIPKETP